MLAKGTNKMIILLIGSPMNRLRIFTLSHNEISTAKTDHKNEISTKNWVGSTWVVKSQLWKKVNAAGQRSKSTLVNGQSQLWSMVKVNTGQRSKSMVNGHGQRWSTRADVALADVALGLTWQ
jgi:hypothetical protein